MTRATSLLVPPSLELIGRLTAIVGREHALTGPGQQASYLREWRERYVGKTPLVLRPGSTGEVSQILRLANEAGTAIVPQAGNTGLVGGQIPSEAGTEIVLSVERMKCIRSIDAAGTHMIVEAGLTLAEVQAAADDAGRMFPLSMASEGSCRIGGNLATNAGGVAVLSYGTARDLVLGLEIVLADGRVWDGLTALAKDNTGYDLKDLFIGSEGTLGIITAATLKLVPKPRAKVTAFAGLTSLDAVHSLFRLAEERAGKALTAFEFMGHRALDFVARHGGGVRQPLAGSHPWYVLIEISSHADHGEAERLVERVLAEASANGRISDAVIAQSLSQAKDLWRIREAISEAQKPEGGSIKHDISVPVTLIAEFIARADVLVEKVCPGSRPVPFGHFGDGNVHYNISQPVGMEKSAFLGLWGPMSRAVHGLVAELGGSISAEHGIGQMKRAELPLVKSAVELELMRAIKAALDPKGILNPGKLL
jgi:FAD/FMN-containing dehydrogenase